MYVEERLDGAKIVRDGPGRQQLLVASTHQEELVIVSGIAEVISVTRHWDTTLDKTVPCECSGPCPSRRLDRFLAVIYRTGPTIWQERLLVLSDQGWHCLIGSLVAKGCPIDAIRGGRCILRRVGNKANGRIECHLQDVVKNVPAGFDVAAAMRGTVGVSADFFGDSEGVTASDQALLPIKTRNQKPRVDKGKK